MHRLIRIPIIIAILDSQYVPPLVTFSNIEIKRFKRVKSNDLMLSTWMLKKHPQFFEAAMLFVNPKV